MKRKEETASEEIQSHIEVSNYNWFSYNIILINGVSSPDLTISSINTVIAVPNVLILNGRGPCQINEEKFSTNSYIKLQFFNTTYYFQCAGNSLISMQLLDENKEYNDNNITKIAKNCQVSEWSEWSKCDGNFQKRTRNVLIYPSDKRQKCPNLEDKIECSHCKVSEWSGWSTCDRNFQKRTRKIIVELKNNGNMCPKNLEERISCSGETTLNPFIDWNERNWANNCDFPGNDLKSIKSPPELCSVMCEETLDCTHYAWSDFEGGTCWLKKGSVSKNDARPSKASKMCGLLISNYRTKRSTNVLDNNDNEKFFGTRFEKEYKNSTGFNSLKECWYSCLYEDPQKKCLAVSFNGKICLFFDNLNSKANIYESDWTSIVKKKQISLILNTIEFTTFPEKYTASVLGASICFDLVKNQSINSLILALDKHLDLTTGWSFFSLKKLASSYSTWSLNMIQNLFLYGSCTSSNRDINSNKIQSFQAFSFVLYYPPEGNCFDSSMESLLNNNLTELNEFTTIINTLSMKKFKSKFLIFDEYKVHRSTNINSPLLLSILIKTVLDSVKYSSNSSLLAEIIRKKLGDYWNVVINHVGDLINLNVAYRAKTFLRLEVDNYDI
ncbi:unnamed protein product, partial [Brachionus calyciflorus]